MFNYIIYDVTVTPLTPLHIGSGKLLLNEYDYVVYKNSTWRIDENAWLEAQNADDPRLVEQLSRTPPAQLIEKKDFYADSPFFRYRMAGKPRATGRGAQLQEMIKTVYDEAYLPGSSLKGAIRTALGWYGWEEKGIRADVRKLERNRKYTGRNLEKDIMGRDPNHDLLRALQVSDSQPAGKDSFMALNVQVVTKGALNAPIELEALKPDTPLKLTMKIDKQLFSTWAKNHRLQLGGNSNWLKNIPKLVQEYTQQRLESELAWYKTRKGAEQAVGFYQQLVNAQLPVNTFLLQVGWGTGWEGKTYGSRLQNDSSFMENIINNYRLAKGKRHHGDAFPKSRRATVRVTKDNYGKIKQSPSVPLGWVLVELKERK